MRKIIDMQMKLFKKGIADIEFDLTSRDEIPKLLMGLQHIYRTKSIRKEVFDVLKNIVPRKTQETGRPGMDLWKILVLDTLRLNCNWDYDKVQEIANHHDKVRQMLGHDKGDFDAIYPLQTIKDNLPLLTPEILDCINQIVVHTGHSIISKKKDSELRGACDSFVLETDVHYPTDTNLLSDAIRKTVHLIAIVCSEVGITRWRQSHHHILKVKGLLRGLQRLKPSTSKDEAKKAQRNDLMIKAHQHYIDVCQDLIKRSEETIHILRELRMVSFSQDMRLNGIQVYIGHAKRQIDQVRRRVIFGESIPHEEKVFSIFEPHTEWISKGKAGVPQELGLKVCVLKDQYGFILHHHVMQNQTDDKVAVVMAMGAKERFPNFISCSFDKGFYTPTNKEQLSNILDNVVLPKKGHLSEKEKDVEQSEEFLKARRKHSAVESSINALENHGLDRCLDHGLHGFKRYVALSVLARNIQILGHLLQQKKLKRQERLKRVAA